MTVNQRIKELRLKLGLSQAKFAKAISISNGYIAGLELGNRHVNERLIKLICITFNVREDWLKTGTGSIFNEEPNQLADRAYSTFKALKPEYQDYVLKQIDQLLEIQSKENLLEASPASDITDVNPHSTRTPEG